MGPWIVEEASEVVGDRKLVKRHQSNRSRIQEPSRTRNFENTRWWMFTCLATSEQLWSRVNSQLRPHFLSAAFRTGITRLFEHCRTLSTSMYRSNQNLNVNGKL